MDGPNSPSAASSKRFGDARGAARHRARASRTGEFVSIVGPSGCGKTTFLRIVAGLGAGKRAARCGSTAAPSKAPGADRGFVFQQDSLLPWRTVLANAHDRPRDRRRRRAEREKRRTLDLLQLVGLAGFEGYFPRQLSGGMRQRVNLARALAIDPQSAADGRAVLGARRADAARSCRPSCCASGSRAARPCSSSRTRSTRRCSCPTASSCFARRPGRIAGERRRSTCRGRARLR